ncbi:MAG: 4-hydroxy-3-methylbut-2-enyl diphosphate reductase [Lachnospiraceae bacterium]|nr:4-hydroxy-3-methylbut-2-enyl diphosphate reductase [Lachnospiraceae bacterium]
MNIKLAKSAGFCFGVKRAVDTVNEQIQNNNSQSKIYTYGPIIHNEEVVNEFKDQGVDVIEEGADVSSLEPGIVIIRSHGTTKIEQDNLEKSGFQVVDATCPFVKKIHNYVRDYSSKGYYILVVGNPNHPEVEGIVGWINGNDYKVISNDTDLSFLEGIKDKNICMVSQTTYNHTKFQDLVEIISEKGYDILVLNTICNATEVRQVEASEISKNVDAMIVIGGKNSSNTQKLFEICKRECEDTYYIQTKDDLDLSVLQSIDNVGITAGASTPKKIIEEVQKYVRNEL